MATATAATETLDPREVFADDPAKALDMALAETERVKAEAQAGEDVTFDGGEVHARTLNGLWRLAKMYAGSEMVPDHFRGKPGNCAVGVGMAIRCGCDPFMFLQGCYVVHGRPGLESKLGIALANQSNAFTGRIHYALEGEGATRQCTASAIDADSGEMCEQTVTMLMAEAEGWTKKSGSKWLTLPDLMLQYRSAMFLIRLYCPEVLMGMQSKEELEDTAIPGKFLPGPPAKTLTDLTAQAKGNDTGEPAEPEPAAGDATAEPGPEPADEPRAGPLTTCIGLLELAETLTMVNEAREICLGRSGITAGQRMEIHTLCDRANDRIKVGRGENCNAK